MSYSRSEDQIREPWDRELYNMTLSCNNGCDNNPLQNVQRNFRRNLTIRSPPPTYTHFPDQGQVIQHVRRPTTRTPRRVGIARNGAYRLPRSQFTHTNCGGCHINNNIRSRVTKLWSPSRAPAVITRTSEPNTQQYLQQRSEMPSAVRVPTVNENLIRYNEEVSDTAHWSRVLADTLLKWRTAFNRPQPISLPQRTRSEYSDLICDLRITIAQISFYLEIDKAAFERTTQTKPKTRERTVRSRRHSH